MLAMPDAVPSHHRAVGGGHDRADPVKLAHVVVHRRHSDQLVHHQGVRDHADRGAVLGRDGLQKIGHHDAAAADHVLRHDGGIARQMRSEIAGHQSRITVVGAADIHANHEIDVLATVEIRHLVRKGCGHESRLRGTREGDADAKLAGSARKPVSRTRGHFSKPPRSAAADAGVETCAGTGSWRLMP